MGNGEATTAIRDAARLVMSETIVSGLSAYTPVLFSLLVCECRITSKRSRIL